MNENLNTDIVSLIKIMLTDLYIEKHKEVLLKIQDNIKSDKLLCAGIWCIRCVFYKKICTNNMRESHILDYERELNQAIKERLEEVKA